MNGSVLPADTLFEFGRMKVEILQGNILAPGRPVDAVVSSDDNYLTMGSGVSRLLRDKAGSIDYVREAQQQCPVRAGTVVRTGSYGLKELLGADHVLHATVIDYDTDRLPLPELVEQTTANCLERAEQLGVRSILMPALATGAGKLSFEECARRMCRAIKEYVALDRLVSDILIVLFLPDATKAPAAEVAECRELNERFVREANLVLGVPYEPRTRLPQIRSFCAGEQALKQLEQIVAGQRDDEGGKRHAVLLGGPFTGKWTLIEQLYQRAQQPGSPLSKGRRLVKVTFGRVHDKTPTSFIYRKFLSALEGTERGRDPETHALLQEIREVYSDPELKWDTFLAFLDRHPDRYAEIVFLIDKLPRLLRMEAKDGQKPEGVWDFWKDLPRLQKNLRFVYTARPEDYDQLRARRLEPYAAEFESRIETIWVGCVTDQEREQWVNDLFIRYLARPEGAPSFVHKRFEFEAGRHPYLIGLYGHALVEALKRDALSNPRHPTRYTKNNLERFFQAACSAIEEARQAFFELLMAIASPEGRKALEDLARVMAYEREKRDLMRAARQEDENAQERLAELLRQGDPRKALDQTALDWLEKRGYVVDVDRKAQFMAGSFATWVNDYFGVGREADAQAEPVDVEISLLHVAEAQAPEAIRTMFQGRGARIVTAQKELHREDWHGFREALGQCISHCLHPVSFPDPGWMKTPEQAGSYLMSLFTTSEIKRYLQHPPTGSTVLFAVDDALKEVPWELMLETAYAGEIPFRVGRRIIGGEPSNINPVVGRSGRVKALLIGDPMGDLEDARSEVEELADRLRTDGRFELEDSDILLGASCQPGPILSRLGSRRYGLIHYSGHSTFDGYRSAWQLKGGQITTDRLTSTLQMGPPALVFSSSCESAVAGQPQPIRYEDQTFDLPSAFLQAGVEVYIGTLWEVEAWAARRFVDQFYDAFLNGKHNLGECLRLARLALKQDEQREDRINWLSFILYGDPHLLPRDLFPILAQ